VKTTNHSAKTFAAALVSAGFESRVFDSTNAWGEGSTGTAFHKPGVRVLVAHAKCRCGAANTKFVTVTLDEKGKHSGARGRVADAEQSGRTFARILNGLSLDGFVGPEHAPRLA
jgi:hypothetical protein